MSVESRQWATNTSLERVMGIFERAVQEHDPAAGDPALTPRQAFAALLLGALNADGRATSEETGRLNEIFNSTRLFGQPSAEPTQAVLDRALQLFEQRGFGPTVTAAAKALPEVLRTPVFTIAVDLVMADGQATGEECKF